MSQTVVRLLFLLALTLLALAGCGTAPTTSQTPAGGATTLPTDGAQEATPLPSATPPPASPTRAASPTVVDPTPSATVVEAATALTETIQVGLELVAEGFGAPILLLSPPDESERRFIVDQLGLIQILTPEGELLAEPFLDLRERLVELYPDSDDERGLLGLAFHPGFAENGRFFTFYTTPPRPEAPTSWDHTNVLSEWRVSPDDPNRADLDSERILLQFDQRRPSHAAGQLLFGPDGLLYVALGDGLQPELYAQTLDTHLGSVLRLDVDGEPPYGIPNDNPFLGGEALPETFAYGFRHPWRLSLDEPTGTIYIAEPGWQFRWQEVNRLTPGGNYGWGLPQKRSCYDPSTPGSPFPDCTTGRDGQPLVAPLLEYGPDLGNIISGAYLYRGAAIPELNGRLVMSEWGFRVSSGAKLLVAQPGEREPWPVAPIEITTSRDAEARYYWGMGRDAAGELYLLTMSGISPVSDKGKIFKIVPTTREE